MILYDILGETYANPNSKTWNIGELHWMDPW
jgi:hypothetical protein